MVTNHEATNVDMMTHTCILEVDVDPAMAERAWQAGGGPPGPTLDCPERGESKTPADDPLVDPADALPARRRRRKIKTQPQGAPQSLRDTVKPSAACRTTSAPSARSQTATGTQLRDRAQCEVPRRRPAAGSWHYDRADQDPDLDAADHQLCAQEGG